MEFYNFLIKEIFIHKETPFAQKLIQKPREKLSCVTE